MVWSRAILDLQYWYCGKETNDRARDIKYVKKYFPDTELIKFKDMGHASMTSLHPQEMAKRMEFAINP